MNYIALICARKGSKGVIGKNSRLLAGKPLIVWSIQAAKQIKRISRIIVSTDSEEIAQIAIEHGAEVPFIRPNELALDNSPEWLVWRHALKFLSENENVKVDGLVVIPPTAPLRNIQDINDCIDEYEKGAVDIVITVSNSHRNPYFNMITNDSRGYCSLVITPKDNISHRQDTPQVFDITTVAYVACPEFVQRFNSLFEGKVRSVLIPTERALDIDTLFDFQVAECLMLDNTDNI